MKYDIGFIGLGKLGMECAEAMVCDCVAVNGYDIEKKLSDKVNVVDEIRDTVIGKDFTFIAVQTPHNSLYDGRFPTSHLENKDFDYSYVQDVLRNIKPYLNETNTIVLISTVLPGTTRRDFLPIIEDTNCNFIYNPYLIAMGTTTWDMLNPEMVIIGGEKNTNDLIDFYKIILDKKDSRFEVGSYEDAESIKIFYNTFISTKVALVNMIQDVAETLGNIDCDKVTNALALSTHRIMSPMYMKAGMGDGGPCHPRDNIALRFLAEKLDLGYDLFDAIMTTREKQSERLANKLISFNRPVIILGKSYKPDVDYIDGSSSILTGHYVEKNSDLKVFYDETPIDVGPFTYLLGHMNRFHDYDFFPDSIIVDPWRSFSSDKFKVIHYGKKIT